MISFFNFLMLLVVILILFIGLFVFLKGKKGKSGTFYLLFIIAVALWISSNLFLRVFENYDLIMISLKLTFVSAVVMFYMLLLFARTFPNDFIKKIHLIDIVGLVVTIFFCIIGFSNLIVSGFNQNQIMIDAIYGRFFILFPLITVFFFIAIFYYLYKQYKMSTGVAKEQAKYVFIGIMLTAVIASMTDIFIPLFTKNNVSANYGSFGAITIVIFSAYAILAHHLFDIRVIIRKTVVYSVLLIFVLAVYSLVIFVFAQAFGTGGQAITAKTIVPNLLAAVFIAAGFEPLRKWLTKCTDKFLFKGEYKPQDVLNKLSGVLSSVLDLDEALTSIIGILVTEMRLTRAGAFVLTHDPESKKMIVKRAKTVGYGEEKITLKPDGYLITYYEQYIKSHKEVTCKDAKDEKKRAIKKCNVRIDSKPIITEELEREAEMNSTGDEIVKNTISELKGLEAQVSLPIIVKGKLIGIFILGAKKSGDIFSDSDLELLTSVANQTAAAIEKARFYEEDQLKSEFVSIASHELLTPTSAIEGYLSMILDEGMGKVDPQAKKYLDNVYASSKRLAGLVKDLLNVSRIEGGRIVVQSKNFDLKEMIKQVVAEMQPKANEKKLQFAAEGLDREVPQVWADPERVHQVLINLIGNAIKYTDKGSVRVRLDFSLSVVRVSVIDTGVGIPKDEIPHLFEKFYRASNADNSGAQGTGLGLYITKQIVELMGGMIQVDSEKGKGSVFSFSLPRAKENEKAIQNK